MLQSYRANTIEALIESSLSSLGLSMLPAPAPSLTPDQKAALKPQVVKAAVLIAFFGGAIGKSEFCRLTNGFISLRKAAKVVGWCSGSVHLARKAEPLTNTEYSLTWAPGVWLNEVIEAAHSRTPRPRRASDALPPRFLLNPPQGA